MAVEQQGIEWVVLSNAAEVYRKDEAAAKRLAESYTKLSKTVNTSTEAGRREVDSLRKVGDATAQVAAKLGAESRIRERAATLVRQHGLAMQTALKASRDLERAGGALTREVIREAQAFDRAEKEVRQLAAAQREAAGTSLTGALNKQSAAMGALRAQLGYLVGVGGIYALVRGVGDLTEAYYTQARAEAQVAARLASTRNAIGLSIEEIKEYASELQKSTGVSDEAILQHAGVLLSFQRIAKENFGGALEAALNLSTALGQDMNSALLQVGKALDDPVRGLTALRRSGTVFTADQERMVKALAETGHIAEAQALILRELDVQYGKTARAIREAAGANQALGAEFGDIKEVLGKLIADNAGLRDYTELLVIAARGTKEFGNEANQTTSKVGPLASAVQGLVASLAIYASFMRLLPGQQKAVTASTGDLAKATFGWWKSSQEAAKQAAALSASLPNVASVLRQVKEATRDQQIDSLVASWQTLLGATAPAEEALRRAAAAMVDGKEAAAQESKALKDLKDAIKAEEEALKKGTEAYKARIKAIDDALELYEELEQRISDVLELDLAGSKIDAGAIEVPPIDVEFTGPEELDALTKIYHKEQEKMREEAAKTAEATSRMLSQLADAFETIGGDFGDMISVLLRLIDTIYQAAQAMQAANASSSGGGAGGAGAGGGGAFASIAAVIGVFVALFQIGNALIDKANAQKYSIPIQGGITGGRFSGQAIASDAAGLSQEQTYAAVQAFRGAIESFERVLGQSLDFFPQLGIEVQNSGDKFRLTINGVVHGLFSTFDEAFQAGFRIALGAIEAADIGPHLTRALGLFGVSTEELVSIIPLLTRFDDALEGIPKGLSAALLAQRQWFTALDQQSKLLLRSGVALETVIQWRREEIAAMIEQVRQGGLQLARVRSFGAGLQEWIDAATATGEAAAEEAKRQKGLESSVISTTTAIGGPGGGGGRGGGLHGAMAAGAAGAQVFGGGVIALTDSLEDGRGPLDDSATGIHGVTNAFVEMVREIVKLEAAKSIFEDLLAFQERTGVQIVANADLREAIARLEFRLFQLRFQQTVLELIAAAELLGLTRAQIHEFERWAKAVGELDFSDISIGGGGGGRGGRRQARQTAAEDWDEALRIMDRRLAGATPQMLALSDAADRLREMGEAAGKTTEEIAAALHDLAELQIADIVTDWAEAIQQSGETDTQTGLRHLADRAIDDLAAAAEAAAGDPELFAGAAETITGGFAALFQGDIQDQIDQLVASGDREGLQALFDQVSTFLDGDFPPEMQGVIDMLRQWLEGAVAAGETTIALSDESAAATERDAAAEAAYRQAAEQSAQAERDLAAARDQARDALTTLVDEGLSPSLAAYRQQMRALDELVQSSLDAAESEEERAFIMDQASRSATRSLAQFAQGLLGEINALGIDLRAAGIDTHAFAMAMLELKRAEVLAALGTEGFAAAAEKWGLDVPAIVATVTGATLELDEAAQSVARSTRSVSEAARHFVAGVGLVEESTETIADIIEEMRRSELTGMAALEQERLDMLARIAAATGTAAERAIALAAAEEMFARKRQELLDEAFGGVDEWLKQITGAGILGTTPGEQLSTAQADLESLAARAAGGDLEAAAALDDQAEAVIDLLSQLYGGRELALLAQQVVDTVAAARLAGGGGPQPQALGSPAPLSLPPLAALPPAPFSAAFGTAQAVADLTTVVAELQAQGAATRRHDADLTQAEMRQRLTLHSEVVPLLRDLKPTRPIAPPGGRG